MQSELKILVAAVLSLMAGVAFASPLFYYNVVVPTHIPKGPTPDVKIDVAYADFGVQLANPNTPIPSWLPKNKTFNVLTYSTVLNVTNNDDKAVAVDFLFFGAAKNVSSGNTFFSTQGVGWNAEGATVDGTWYNVTLIKGTIIWPQFDASGKIESVLSFNNSEGFAPYLQEGVQIYDRYTNGSIIATYLNMNGTWTDVTGRINVIRPEQSNMTAMLYPIVSETRFFVGPRNDVHVYEYGYAANTITPVGLGKFSNIWAPHETRLIFLNGTRFVDSSALETLRSGEIFLRVQASTHLANSFINGTLMDTSSLKDAIELVELQTVGKHYLYNNILGKNQMFKFDAYGVEVTVKPRS